MVRCKEGDPWCEGQPGSVREGRGGVGHLEPALLVEQGAKGVSELGALLSEQAAGYPGVGSPQHLVVGVS